MANSHSVLMTTNNAYDSILLVDAANKVVGAWSPATKADVEAYLMSGRDAADWDATYPDATAIEDYGTVCGRDGRLDESRRTFWGF